ncbi:putative Mannose-6-phosphate isomerase [Paratrimastix pyriformis]|uniref:mannose-6-phosphate isomerase n=1 Tax=Paratrimastix pyriformis TaxID=342808 RepID=A0ABQ8UM57_9EUKA|nr:putative Mannose-6-phosphate isomerase [Paratrimastix pyriformis]
MFRLSCEAKQYAWGKVGQASIVAKFSGGSIREEPFAELWMGTHPSGPSEVVVRSNEKVKLPEFLRAHPDFQASSPELPFLFKVLSIGMALSIQSHPDLTRARALHSTDPKHYPDPNHKPELCCALSELECLCGLRSVAEVATFVAQVDELRDVLLAGGMPRPDIDALREGGDPMLVVRAIEATLRCRPATIKDALERLMAPARLAALAAREPSMDAALRLAGRLQGQFPFDCGVLVGAFLLRYHRLAPGEALFLGPNVPHAYLAGDCVEIMATSDNVVRAGLTPKFKDVAVLCEMLAEHVAASPVDPAARSFHCDPSCPAPHLSVYAPPVPEFQLVRLRVPADCPQGGVSWCGHPTSAAIAIATQPCWVSLGRPLPPAFERIERENNAAGCDLLQLGAGSVVLLPANRAIWVDGPNGDLWIGTAAAAPALAHK